MAAVANFNIDVGGQAWAGTTAKFTVTIIVGQTLVDDGVGDRLAANAANIFLASI